MPSSDVAGTADATAFSFSPSRATAGTGADDFTPDFISSAPDRVTPRKPSPNAPLGFPAHTSISSAPATATRPKGVCFVRRGAPTKTGAAESVPDPISSAPGPLTSWKLSRKAPPNFTRTFLFHRHPLSPLRDLGPQNGAPGPTTQSAPHRIHRHPSVSTPRSPVDSGCSSAAGCIGTRPRS